MKIAKDLLKVLLVMVGALSLYFGVIQGEWGETMFNATLL